MFRHARLALILGLCLLAAQSHAGPPFNVDDPATTEYRRFNLILAFLSSHGPSGEAQAPTAQLMYGVTQRFEVGVSVGALTQRPPGGPRMKGIQDTYLSARWRFMDEDKVRPQVLLGYMPKLPTADPNRGLGSGNFDHTLWLSAAKSFGRWQLAGNLGYNFLGGTAGTNNGFWGVQLTHQLTEQLILGGQIYGASSPAPGSASETAWGLGLIYNYAPDQSFLFQAGRSMRGNSELNVYAGISLTFQ